MAKLLNSPMKLRGAKGQKLGAPRTHLGAGNLHFSDLANDPF
jgi:hypothetical protein